MWSGRTKWIWYMVLSRSSSVYIPEMCFSLPSFSMPGSKALFLWKTTIHSFIFIIQMTQHEVIWLKYFIFSPHSHVYLHVIGVWSWDGHSQRVRAFLRCSRPATYRYSLPNTGRTYSQTLPQWTCPHHVPQQPWKHCWNPYVEPKHCGKATEAAQLSQPAQPFHQPRSHRS